MGGCWVHWNQPHTYGQITRYGMRNEIKATFDTSGGVNVSDAHYHLGGDERPIRMSHEEEDSIYKKPAELYFDVDGEMGRKILPFPQDPFYNPEIRKYDGLTAFGRLDQIRDQLTPLEAAALEAYLLLMSGGTAESTGFFDVLRWWALCDYRSDAVNEYGVAYKLRCGTTGLARRIFEDGRSSGNLTVDFMAPVKSIKDSKEAVVVTTMAGVTYTSTKVISTIPLNVLKDITFTPPLSPTKAAAVQAGHIGLGSKIHFEVRGQAFRSWSGYAYPGRGLLYAYGDDTTPADNTHIVSFGAASVPLQGEDDIEKTKMALLDMRDDIEIDRIMFHDWVRDPYARGAWCMFPKDFASKYTAALQEEHGNVWFANSDWADGWRGFIDGAIEQGIAVAQRVADALATTERTEPPLAK